VDIHLVLIIMLDAISIVGGFVFLSLLLRSLLRRDWRASAVTLLAPLASLALLLCATFFVEASTYPIATLLLPSCFLSVPWRSENLAKRQALAGAGAVLLITSVYAYDSLAHSTKYAKSLYSDHLGQLSLQKQNRNLREYPIPPSITTPEEARGFLQRAEHHNVNLTINTVRYERSFWLSLAGVQRRARIDRHSLRLVEGKPQVLQYVLDRH
jgi:hypothetical protein